MNLTRIQVPFPLPEPHFDDEATVVSARQVVPLGEARIQDRRRKVLAILPTLLAAALCGALGAVVVNYFWQRPSAPTVSQPSATSASREEQLAPAPSPENNVTTPGLPDQVAETSEPTDSSVSNDSSAKVTVGKPPASNPEPAVADPKKPSNPADPKQLVRQRRVNPPSTQTNNQKKAGQNDPLKSRGAARIEDIFGGPNP
jgi:hypothetical protein